MTARYAPEEVVVTVTYYVIYYYDFILKEAHAASLVGIYHFWGCSLVNFITFSSYLSDCIALWALQHCSIWILFFSHWISPLYVFPIQKIYWFHANLIIHSKLQDYIFTGLKKKGGGLVE